MVYHLIISYNTVTYWLLVSYSVLTILKRLFSSEFNFFFVQNFLNLVSHYITVLDRFATYLSNIPFFNHYKLIQHTKIFI